MYLFYIFMCVPASNCLYIYINVSTIKKHEGLFLFYNYENHKLSKYNNSCWHHLWCDESHSNSFPCMYYFSQNKKCFFMGFAIIKKFKHTLKMWLCVGGWMKVHLDYHKNNWKSVFLSFFPPFHCQCMPSACIFIRCGWVFYIYKVHNGSAKFFIFSHIPFHDSYLPVPGTTEEECIQQPWKVEGSQPCV